MREIKSKNILEEEIRCVHCFKRKQHDEIPYCRKCFKILYKVVNPEKDYLSKKI